MFWVEKGDISPHQEGKLRKYYGHLMIKLEYYLLRISGRNVKREAQSFNIKLENYDGNILKGINNK